MTIHFRDVPVNHEFVDHLGIKCVKVGPNQAVVITDPDDSFESGEELFFRPKESVHYQWRQ